MPAFFHVTSRAAAETIIAEGFYGGWGDDGFGVYLYDNSSDAMTYAANGGWDGDLEDPVIIEIECEYQELFDIEVDPEWPNPEDYVSVARFPMDPNDDEARWQPERMIHCPEPPSP